MWDDRKDELQVISCDCVGKTWVLLLYPLRHQQVSWTYLLVMLVIFVDLVIVVPFSTRSFVIGNLRNVKFYLYSCFRAFVGDGFRLNFF